MAERPDKLGRNKVQVIPDPKRPDLFEFLVKNVLDDDMSPERLDLRQCFGPGGRKYGATIFQKEFKPNAAKPTREDMVALSNRFLDESQNNCNAIGKPHKYGVCAKNHHKSDTYYAVFLLSLKPTQEAEYDPNATEDEDDVTPDVKRRDSLLAYSLDHIKQADENERWRQDQHSTSTGDVISKYAELVQILISHNVAMMAEHRELFKTADEALNHKAERDRALKDQDFKHEMLGNAFQFLRAMAPVALQKLQPPGSAKELSGTITETPESIGVRTFLEGLSETQARALFGDINQETHRLVGNGVFNENQVDIFAGVAELRYPSDMLDKISPGGEFGVTETQVAAASVQISQQQSMPLYALMMNRKKG